MVPTDALIDIKTTSKAPSVTTMQANPIQVKGKGKKVQKKSQEAIKKSFRYWADNLFIMQGIVHIERLSQMR